MNCPNCDCVARARGADQQRAIDLFLASGLTIGALEVLPQQPRPARGEIGGKRCSNCFCWKPLAEFYRKLDAHQSRCKSCNAEVVAGYHARARERLRERLAAGRRA